MSPRRTNRLTKRNHPAVRFLVIGVIALVLAGIVIAFNLTDFLKTQLVTTTETASPTPGGMTPSPSPSVSEALPGSCGDELDNNDNGAKDCADPVCNKVIIDPDSILLSPWTTKKVCDSSLAETPPDECNDSKNNDTLGDGSLYDYMPGGSGSTGGGQFARPSYADCWDQACWTPVTSDGYLTPDSVCASSDATTSESASSRAIITTTCTNGRDDNNNKAVDCDDKMCKVDFITGEEGNRPDSGQTRLVCARHRYERKNTQCTDGKDNNNDGVKDDADRGCWVEITRDGVQYTVFNPDDNSEG